MPISLAQNHQKQSHLRDQPQSPWQRLTSAHKQGWERDSGDSQHVPAHVAFGLPLRDGSFSLQCHLDTVDIA